MTNKRRLSRRTLLKTGLAGGGAALLAAPAIHTRAQTGSPATTPFVDELPIPPIAQPALPLAGRAAGMPFRAFAPAPNPAALRYGNEALDRWAACPALSTPEQIVRSLEWLGLPG